jgi:hypothetical protein
MRCHVVQYKFNDVLEDHAASIIRVAEESDISLELLLLLVTVEMVINKHSSFFTGANEILSTIATLCKKTHKCSLNFSGSLLVSIKQQNLLSGVVDDYAKWQVFQDILAVYM